MAFISYRETAGRLLRGDAAALSKQQVSQTISFARIVLIVGLVFLHYLNYPDTRVSPFTGMDVAQHQFATFINSYVLFFFFSVVPLLSMVSGWLFFSFDPQTAGTSLRHRIRKRFTSLYLPIVFWDILYLTILSVLFAFRPHAAVFGQLVELNFPFGHAGPMDYINALFGITEHPLGFQFWFVRDLFVTVLVSPLLWLSLRKTPYLGMLVLGAAWITDSHLVIFFRTDVVFFFYMGGFLKLRQLPLHVGRTTAWSLMALYMVLVGLRTAAPWLLELVHGGVAPAWANGGVRPEWLNMGTRSLRLLGVVACWGVFQQLAHTAVGARIARYGGLAFFLHSAHYPLIAEMKVLLWPLLPAHTDGWLLLHFVASVAATVTIGISLGLLLARKAPRVFALMNGGRPGTGPQGRDVTSSGATPAVLPLAMARVPAIDPSAMVDRERSLASV